MTYGYARCSTNETRQDITRQVRELENMGVAEGNIYLEYESGMKADRPELNKLLKQIQPGDTLIATEISRITRSTKQLCDIIEFASEMKIKLIIGSFVVDCSGPKGLDALTEGIIKTMGVFAEMERNMIVERIRSGVNHARSKGVRLGRPRITVKDIPGKVIEHLPLYLDKKISKTEYARLCCISRQTLYNYLKLIKEGK